MGVFYHLDRTGESLRAGQILEFGPLPAGLSPDELAIFGTLCPTGVTRFGHDILTKQLEPNALERELEVERIRRDCYPHRITRYAVIFGCKAMPDVDVLRWQFFDPSYNGQRGRVWKIRGTAVFRADMNWFKEHCGDYTTAAHAYWSQQESERPLIEYLLQPPVTVLEEILSA
ncbi:MAG: hypothetical protein ACLQIB_06945 [Isosphaeraceae bacterium]